jgi:hypothetical protein
MRSPTSLEPIERYEFDAARLMADHQPALFARNKRIVQAIACPPGSTHHGTLGYSRWAALPLPAKLRTTGALRRLEAREGTFDYAPVSDSGAAVEWHVNFADPVLFVAYGSSLMAQDEMQVAEHPALGALKEALEALGHQGLTMDDGPTPVLITGVERRCRIATDRNPELGRPRGLYGSEFARAGADAVERAVTAIDPPTITNLIAMSAPFGGRGSYKAREIGRVLTTAFTGFSAATVETRRVWAGERGITVHTGFWGCGAFGGNRTLMALLQLIAADAAGVERLVFHTVSPEGSKALENATILARRAPLAADELATEDAIERIESLELQWGVSDGN